MKARVTGLDREAIKQIARRLTEVERTPKGTIAEIERTTLSQVDHNPKRVAEAQRCLKNVDVE